jgi:polyhydroxyalkanoate synthesis repressor PhaR
MLLVKKYPNRRLYDTRNSRYITLDDLEKTVRAGEDVAVQDAQDGRDLTQETLTQIILDRGGGRILPAALLLRLIRLDDAALGEFLTRYVSWALEIYLQAKGRAQALLPLNPLATAPFAATDALARLVLGATQWGRGAPPAPPSSPFSPEEPPPSSPLIDVPPIPEAPGSDPALRRDESSAEGGHLRVVGGRAPKASEITDEMQRLRQEIEALKVSMGIPAVGGGRSRTAKKAKARARRPGKRP